MYPFSSKPGRVALVKKSDNHSRRWEGSAGALGCPKHTDCLTVWTRSGQESKEVAQGEGGQGLFRLEGREEGFGKQRPCPGKESSSCLCARGGEEMAT